MARTVACGRAGRPLIAEPTGQPYPPRHHGEPSGYPPPLGTPPVAPVDGFAITSLVLGLMGGVLFSVGFGIAALRRIGRGSRRGKGLAIAGLSVSLVWVLVFVGAILDAAGRKPTRNSDGIVQTKGQVGPTTLRLGDCVQVPRDLTGTIRTLSVVPCTQLHNGQVFTILQAEDGSYPGTAALKAQALAGCQAAVPSFIGKDSTPLHVIAFVPLQARWTGGDRSERCLLVDRQRDITGDIRKES